MVNESDPTSKPDYFAYNQFSARDLPVSLTFPIVGPKRSWSKLIFNPRYLDLDDHKWYKAV